MKNTDSSFLVIAGCGLLGSHLADTFSKNGYNVVIIDEDENSFKYLSPEFTGFIINGSVSEYKILKRAKMENAEYFFAVTNSDTLNIMCSQIAKTHFKVKKITARVKDPLLNEYCRHLDINTISPITAISEYILKTII